MNLPVYRTTIHLARFINKIFNYDRPTNFIDTQYPYTIMHYYNDAYVTYRKALKTTKSNQD